MASAVDLSTRGAGTCEALQERAVLTRTGTVRGLVLGAVLLASCSATQQVIDGRTTWATDYATEAPSGPAALGPGSAEIESLLRQAFQDRAQLVVHPDARLARIADWLAERNAAGDAPQVPRRIAMTTRVGVPFPTPAVIELRYTAGIESSRLREAIVRQVTELSHTAQLARYGVAVRSTPEMQFAVAVLTAADVDFEPVPRHLETGDTLTLHGSLTERFQHPRVAVTLPNGKTQNLDGQGSRFDFAVRLPEPGSYAIEIIGDGALGPSVLANFPVYVDTPEPALPREQATEQVTSPAAVEAELLALINADRKKAGVGPLLPWPTLATVARAHSQDMVDHKFIAHVSPTLGTTEDRLKRAGIAWQAFGENIGMASTTREIHEGLMASPGHREAIVNPAYTHVGIGAALQLQDKSYVPVVTEEFVAIPPAVK